MQQVQVGNRTYSFEDVLELIRSSAVADGPEKMAKHQELSALNLWASLAQAQALAQIAIQLGPVNVHAAPQEDFGFPDALAVDDTPPADVIEASQLDDIFEARRQFAVCKRSKRLQGWLNEMIDKRSTKMIFPLNEQPATLTIFFEQSKGDRPWRYIVTDTAGGREELNEDHAVRLVENDAKKPRTPK